MKTLRSLTLILTLVSASLTKAFAVVPENDLHIPPLVVKDFETVSEHDFNTVTRILHKIYTPAIKEKGNVTFVMNADWQDDTVNAYATREVDTWTVHIAGGIARAKGMTKESLALIVCHEIGHHLGGAPRTFLYEGWPSAEGQADYWATSKCLKNYYNELRNEEVVLNDGIPDKVIKDCSAVYKNVSELKICLRSMLATIHFGHFLNHLPDAKVPVSIDASDSRIVKGTNTNDYPRPQCRIDTLYQGALCPVGSNVATSESDAKIGHCNDVNRPGSRPRCWYKP